ncbi:hypothetical protein R3P38DRAFT_2601535 [Favolaschia claudopus]|uniref:F-box domain-containing protein n=1 Tax=Favolaschia claudopus TaxID=2862362 RepID=A0AAW0DP37_9AGAR
MEPTACQKVFAIQEIVSLICFESFEPYFPKKTRFASLLALSRTSKIFTEPALDRLWWEQKSLAPLIKCMPEDAWEEHVAGTGRNATTTLHLRRPLKSTDLPRMLYYSERIRELCLTRFASPKLHHGLLRALDMALPVRTFMPKLVDLTWCSSRKDVTTILRHILGPRVRNIHLNLDNTEELSILPFVRSACPQVSDFELVLPQNSQGSTPVVSDLVCGWENLTDLYIPNLDKAGFIHIAHLSSLNTLNLWFVDDLAPSHPPDFLVGPSFPKLEYLSIRCRTANFCAGVVQVIASRQLTSLSISPMSSWTSSAWQKLHTVIQECLDHTALDSIEVKDWDGLVRPAEDELASYRISLDVLRPLLAFKRLEQVAYQTYPDVDVGDDFLEEMAKAWPRLSSLHLCNEVLITQPPRATLRCLLPFARHCRHLEALGIRIHARNIPAFTQLAGHRIAHELQYMYVGTSYLLSWDDMEGKVAAFISDLFPTLDSLMTSSEELPEALASHRASWDRVSCLLPVFLSVRSQEKKFWTEELKVDDSDEEYTSEEGSREEGEDGDVS